MIYDLNEVSLQLRQDASAAIDGWERHYSRQIDRVDKSRSRASGGVGLGLALAQQIAALHGGSLTIEKSDEAGTVFLCRL